MPFNDNITYGNSYNVINDNHQQVVNIFFKNMFNLFLLDTNNYRAYKTSINISKLAKM